jgi:hypothetical protein
MLLLARKDEENADKDDNDEHKAVHVTVAFIPPTCGAVNGYNANLYDR